MRYVTRWLLCSLVVVGPLGAESLSEARQLYFAGVNGDFQAAQRATALWESHLRQDPDDPVGRAYLGSLRLWEAAHTGTLPRKLQRVQEGLRLLDEAVAAQPQDAEVRFVRAASVYHLPALFRRRRQAEEDFSWLADQVTRDNPLPPPLAAATLYFDGQIRRARRDMSGAAARFRLAQERWPDTPAGRDAGRELARLRF